MKKRKKRADPERVAELERLLDVGGHQRSVRDRYLGLLLERPDVAVAEAARELGVDPVYLHRVAWRLREEDAR